MTMKQTQTKLFEFSDVGLDFCAGSKNLFPDRFKKILSLGYNEQTVTSIIVTGDQVTLTYGGAHGYEADRVLKVDSGALAAINDGEFWIDSVTANTVTMTIDDAPISVAGGFVTKIASLGWQLMYEQAHIHIYKFKHIDDTDMYARLCFQNATAAGNRNCIAVGIGRTVDLVLGYITDPNCYADLGTCATVLNSTANLKWDFTNSVARTFDNYTYAQGDNTFGKGSIVGSAYHVVIMTNIGAYTTCGYTQGILPVAGFVDFPLLLCSNNAAATTRANTTQLPSLRAYIAKLVVFFEPKIRVTTSIATDSFSATEGFNTTTSKPMFVYESSTGQMIGCVIGLYQAMYANTNRPSISNLTVPIDTRDIDLNNIIKIQSCSSSATEHAWFAAPVEEIKIVH